MLNQNAQIRNDVCLVSTRQSKPSCLPWDDWLGANGSVGIVCHQHGIGQHHLINISRKHEVMALTLRLCVPWLQSLAICTHCSIILILCKYTLMLQYDIARLDAPSKPTPALEGGFVKFSFRTIATSSREQHSDEYESSRQTCFCC
jgi:hypothetical protein